MDETCKQPPQPIKTWKLYLQWILRIAIIVGSILAIMFGELFFGLLALITLGVVVLFRRVTRNRVCFVPVDIEILVLTVVFFELILADANSFYTRITYYDKFMHFLVPCILGLIGMMIIYTMYALDRLKASLGAMFAIIILVVMGLGAFLELAEFFYDQVLYQYIGNWLPTGLTQGSNVASPHQDTMEDLLFNFLGALFGALLGVWLIRKAEAEGQEPSLVGDIETLIEE